MKLVLVAFFIWDGAHEPKWGRKKVPAALAPKYDGLYCQYHNYGDRVDWIECWKRIKP